MADVWTHGSWTVKPGREAEFVAAWKEMLERATADPGIPDSSPTLLRDRDRPNVFVSFGPWPDAEAVAHFRASEAFRAGVGRMQELLESFETQTLDEVHPGG
jgi:quinol monooxygenase YgiN